MGNVLYIIALLLIAIWSVVFIGYNTGGAIHILPVIAVIAVSLRYIQVKRNLEKV